MMKAQGFLMKNLTEDEHKIPLLDSFLSLFNPEHISLKTPSTKVHFNIIN
jgi:hypothetical protein